MRLNVTDQPMDHFISIHAILEFFGLLQVDPGEL